MINKPDTSELDQQRKQLQAEGADCLQQFRRTHAVLHRHLARGYLWWREAVKVPGYLEDLYKEHSIEFQQGRDNKQNYNPLVRLLFPFANPLEPKDRVTVWQWARAIRAMDEHYNERPSDFEHNPVGKLADYIEERGGIGAITSRPQDHDDEDENEDPEGATQHARELIDPKVHAEVYRRTIETLKRQDGIAQIDIRKTIRVGADGFLVILAQVNQNEQVTLLASSNDPLQIENVATSAAERNFGALPYTLRVPTEAISTQAYPPFALPPAVKRGEWLGKKYAEKGEVRESELPGWTEEGKGKLLPSSKQLLLRGPENDLIFSGNRISVSPVTRLRLTEPLIEPDDTVFLRVQERAYIEQLVETGEIAVLQVDNTQSIPPNDTGGPAAYKLATINPVTATTTLLHFYRRPAGEKTHYQADFRRDEFKADWTASVPSSFFQQQRQRWADPWFAGRGRYNMILRDENSTLQLRVTKAAFTIVFNLGIDSEAFLFPTELSSFTFQLTSFFSKDLGPILFNLADAPVLGDITIAGNKHALVLSYSTDIGDFEIAVPTLAEEKKKSVRDGTLFYAMGRTP